MTSVFDSRLPGLRRRVTTEDGVGLEVREWGDPEGPEILLIPGVAQSYLSFVAQYSAPGMRQFRIVSYDPRGHGLSDKPLDAAHYQEGRRWTADVRAVLEGAGLRRPVLAGWSLGGRIVRQYLVDCGDAGLSGVVFISCRPVEVPEVVGPGNAVVRSLDIDDEASRIDVAAAFLRNCFHRQPTAEEFAFALAYNMLCPFEIRLAIAGWATAPAVSEAALRQVSVPALVMHGRADVLVLPGAAAITARLIGHAQTQWYDALRTLDLLRGRRAFQCGTGGLRRRGMDGRGVMEARALGGTAPRVATAGWLGRADALLAAVVEHAAAALLLVEIIVLASGVVARYGLHHPFVWTDEVDSTLFLWLGIFGAVIALRRAQHMRMTTLVALLPERVQVVLSGLSLAVILAFLVALLPAAVEHLETESAVITPTLEISSGWRAAAMPVGVVLLIATALFGLGALPRRVVIVSLLAVAAAVGVLALLKDYLVELGQADLAIFFLAGVPLLVFAGVPIAFAFLAATFGYLSCGTYVPTSILAQRLDAGMSQLLLLAIPTFVFLGLLIEMTGMAKRMVEFLAGVLGHLRGGLQYVLVVAMYLVSGISGSKAADMAAIAPPLFPEMEKLGNDRAAMTALLAATGAQTETVPPSLILITVGSVTGLSIAALFTAGLLPSAFLAVLLCIVVWFESRGQPIAVRARVGTAATLRNFVGALPALALPFVIRSAVVEGVATATEVSTVGVVYTVIAGLLVYRQFAWRRVLPMLIDTAALSGAILLVTGAATAMAWAITQSGFSHALAQAVTAAPGGSVTFMALSLLLFAILGSVLEGLPAMLLFAPLMFPIARGLGINEIYYAIVTILAMSLGLFTPPFGVGFYITCAICGAEPNRSMRYLWPYLATLTVGVIVVAAVPWLSTGFLN